MGCEPASGHDPDRREGRGVLVQPSGAMVTPKHISQHFSKDLPPRPCSPVINRTSDWSAQPAKNPLVICCPSGFSQPAMQVNEIADPIRELYMLTSPAVSILARKL